MGIHPQTNSDIKSPINSNPNNNNNFNFGIASLSMSNLKQMKTYKRQSSIDYITQPESLAPVTSSSQPLLSLPTLNDTTHSLSDSLKRDRSHNHNNRSHSPSNTAISSNSANSSNC